MKKIYVDMYGVIADYEGAVKQATGHEIQEWIDSGQWEEVKEKLHNNKFYLNLSPMPLVEVLKKYIGQFEILTAVGDYASEEVAQEKARWLGFVFSDAAKQIKFNYVRKSHEKAKFSNEDALLIDDRSKSLIPFAAKGGRILHYKGDVSQDAFIDELFRGL